MPLSFFKSPTQLDHVDNPTNRVKEQTQASPRMQYTLNGLLKAAEASTFFDLTGETKGPLPYYLGHVCTSKAFAAPGAFPRKPSPTTQS